MDEIQTFICLHFLPTVIIIKVTTEEHLENIFNNIELDNKEITSHCNLKTLTQVNFDRAIICKLCEISDNITKQYQLGYQEEKAVEKNVMGLFTFNLIFIFLKLLGKQN